MNTKPTFKLFIAFFIATAWLSMPFLFAVEIPQPADELVVFKASLIEFDNGLCLLKWLAGGKSYQALSNMRGELAAMIQDFDLNGVSCQFWKGRGYVEDWTVFWGGQPPVFDPLSLPPNGSPASYVILEPSGERTAADNVEIGKLDALVSCYNGRESSLESGKSALDELNRQRKLLPTPPKPVSHPKFRRIRHAALLPGALPDFQRANLRPNQLAA